MTTRVTSNGPSAAVVATSTAPRTTPATTRPFNQVMGASASAVVAGAEAAVRGLPGGPLLAAAMRPAGSGATTPELGDLRAEGSSGTAAAFGEASTSSGAAGGSGVEATLASSADQNMYYLQLQERISAESRAYSALSNVLKARHDTIKNAIGNIR